MFKVSLFLLSSLSLFVSCANATYSDLELNNCSHAYVDDAVLELATDISKMPWPQTTYKSISENQNSKKICEFVLSWQHNKNQAVKVVQDSKKAELINSHQTLTLINTECTEGKVLRQITQKNPITHTNKHAALSMIQAPDQKSVAILYRNPGSLCVINGKGKSRWFTLAQNPAPGPVEQTESCINDEQSDAPQFSDFYCNMCFSNDSEYLAISFLDDEQQKRIYCYGVNQDTLKHNFELK